MLVIPSYADRKPMAAAAKQATAKAKVESKDRVAVDAFARTELFFGAARPDGSMVTDEEWRRFLDQEVTPRFPDGLTVFSGVGQFRDSSGAIIQEKSRVLILLYPIQTRDRSSEKIEQIRNAYKSAFQQQSVLRVDDRRPVLVSY